MLVKLSAFLHDHYKVWLNLIVSAIAMSGQVPAGLLPKPVLTAIALVTAINGVLHFLPDQKTTASATPTTTPPTN